MSDIVERLRNPVVSHSVDPETKAIRIVLDMLAIDRDREDAADEIDILRSLLRRIDDVTTWETTPLGRAFQDEVESALRRQGQGDKG